MLITVFETDNPEKNKENDTRPAHDTFLIIKILFKIGVYILILIITNCIINFKFD